jgi:hypothetical protein
VTEVTFKSTQGGLRDHLSEPGELVCNLSDLSQLEVSSSESNLVNLVSGSSSVMTNLKALETLEDL